MLPFSKTPVARMGRWQGRAGGKDGPVARMELTSPPAEAGSLTALLALYSIVSARAHDPPCRPAGFRIEIHVPRTILAGVRQTPMKSVLRDALSGVLLLFRF